MTQPRQSAREAAFHALWHYATNQKPVKGSLDQWAARDHPQPKDRALAQEIAYGTVRRQASLHDMTRSLHEGRLKLKPRERVLLWMALYQHELMDRIPDYAIIDETMALIKKWCHRHSHSFLYHLLQKMKDFRWVPPEDWGVRYSYLPYFVEKLRAQYGDEQAREILKKGNEAPTLSVRMRKQRRVVTVEDLSVMEEMTRSPEFYIQNFTPVALMEHLAEGMAPPETLLDLCASPGGKLLCGHDLFPEAKLFANDVSEEKLARLQENIRKYGLEVTVSCGKGQDWTGEQKMDLILLDVPCSNSGVLNKRAEARWRITPKALEELKETQQALLAHASRLLSPKGQIWYLTCSILQEENEEQVAFAQETLGLRLLSQKLVLPNSEGWDGGFAVALTP